MINIPVKEAVDDTMPWSSAQPHILYEVASNPNSSNKVSVGDLIMRFLKEDRQNFTTVLVNLTKGTASAFDAVAYGVRIRRAEQIVTLDSEDSDDSDT